MGRVRAIKRPGGVRREGSVREGDVGNVTLDQGDYLAVFWPTRYVTTIESVRDVERIR